MSQMRTLLSTSLLASLLASVSFAAEAGTITGTVKNADGTPFRAAFVRVQNTKNRMTMMVLSDGRAATSLMSLRPAPIRSGRRRSATRATRRGASA